MDFAWTSYRNALAVSLGLFVVAGCGGDETPNEATGANNSEQSANQTQQAEPIVENASKSNSLPTAAITNPTKTSSGAENSSTEASKSKLPEKGSAEWILRQITIERLVPLPKSDAVEIRKAKHERNKKIVDLATQVIVLTHKDGQKQLVFEAAVRYLMEAQMNLALEGDADSIDELYAHAESLFQRDPKSKSASEAAFTLARFAHTNAQRYANQEPRWVEEFSRQARLFATNFPQDEPRAVSLLFSAAQSCEFYNMTEESVRCYSTIQESFPKNPRASQAAGCMRRLELKGQKLQLAGPTIDGGFISVDDYRGKLVLVVYWGTQAKPFQDQLPLLKKVIQRFQPGGLEVIGVNMDTDESTVDAFLESSAIGWRQIFYTEPEKRGWNNPIAVYYGIRTLPAIWLVGRDGRVLSTAIQTQQLDDILRKQF